VGLVWIVAVIAMSVGAMGCGDDDDGATDDDSGGGGRDASVGDDGGAGRAGTGGGGTSGRGGTGGRSGAGGRSGSGGAGSGSIDDGGLADIELSDAEVAAVLRAANTGEVEQGELAMMQASNDDVVAYAARMVDEHTAANMRLDELLDAESIEPEENALSEQLTAESMDTLAELEDESGMDFDLAYMEAQRTAHAQVLEIADEVLLPSTQNADLRAELQMLRPAVADHLADAEALLEELE
jgi:putative membrane protein